MNKHRALVRRSQLRRASGFSLIELMISLTIGLVIAVAAMSAYLGSAGASKASDAEARMNEDGQAALNVLTQQLRMAGNNPFNPNRASAFRHNPVYNPSYSPYGTTSFTVDPVAYTMTTFSVRGCDGPFSNLTSAANLDALTCAGTSTLPDSIAINYEADRYNTIPTSTGAPTDCVNGSLPSVTATFASGTTTTATFSVADNRFYIGTSTVGAVTVPSLYCKGAASATQPLVENIEDMQFSYGAVATTTTSTTATIAGYLSAAEVVALGTNPATDSVRWGKVLAVRICVLVRSEAPVLSEGISQQYVKCDGTVDTTMTDRRLRRTYSTTVVLRNRRS